MKKGFTLIELLAVVVILTIIFMIAIPSMNKAINETDSLSSSQLEQEIISSAKDYVNNYDTTKLKSLINVNDCTYLSISTLVSEGLISSNDTDYIGIKIILGSNDKITYELTTSSSCAN